ncbi:EAL domain-containing protein [Roseomonas sp. GC11]|uniref:putative bifunctional diguanylate cyclase/phosphodiesterase n=1 Tax=Roseomonas sp. GC11 TaxID=2950546 RepID=UPI00210B6DAB|nr:EAL domain-containing protein [Roseomonas sp. GC11]MCQ4162606.1 EAL domain-containing protein [Roseomonas sp. GC11]
MAGPGMAGGGPRSWLARLMPPRHVLARWLPAQCAQSWPGRQQLQALLGATALVFFFSLNLSVLNTAAQDRLRASLQGGSFSLAAVEAARFEAALSRHAVGLLPAALLQDRFLHFAEALRACLLLTEAEAAMAEAPRALAAVLPQLETDLRRLLEGEGAALPALLGRLSVLEAELRDLSGLSLREQQQGAEAADGGMGWTFLASAAGLALSAGALVVLLLLESGRARAAQRQAEQAARQQAEAERTLRALIDSLPAMISAYDRHGQLLFMNEAHARFHGINLPGGAVGAAAGGANPGGVAPGGVTPGNVPPGERPRLEQALVTQGPLPFLERTLRDSQGQDRTVLSTAVAVRDGQGGAGRVVLIGLDISERKAAEERMRHLAEHDPLTDLPNRLLFGARLEAAIAKARAGMSQGFALHCLDIDGFRAVNESMGHAVGDQLLLAAVERMRRCLRRADTLARIGGDEFAVIQADVGAPEDARRLAERLVRAMRAPFRLEGHGIESAASIGTAIGLRHGSTAEQLQQRANVALDRAKAEGRGAALLFDPIMETALQERRQLEADLRQGLEAGELVLLYQPKFSLATGAPEGCEALLRWTHAARGAIPPSLFVPVAEEAGMAATLGRYVLRAACAQALRWRAEGVFMPVAVNLSAMLFASDQAVTLVREALAESGLPPSWLEIELTEGVFIRNAAAAQAALEALHATGVRVALDDFGTGYSSLAYLQRLPFDVLKVDRAFVRGLTEGERNSAWIIETILRLAHGLGAKAVAEGVETPEQLAALRRMGCDVAQGFLLGRPMAAEALSRLARQAGVPDGAAQG